MTLPDIRSSSPKPKPSPISVVVHTRNGVSDSLVAPSSPSTHTGRSKQVVRSWSMSLSLAGASSAFRISCSNQTVIAGLKHAHVRLGKVPKASRGPLNSFFKFFAEQLKNGSIPSAPSSLPANRQVAWKAKEVGAKWRALTDAQKAVCFSTVYFGASWADFVLSSSLQAYKS